MSQSNDLIPPELHPVADALRSLDPASTTISRDRLLFEAGRAAATSRFGWVWQTSTALLAGVSAVLAGFLVSPDSRQPMVVERERIVVVRVPEAPSEAPSLPAAVKPPESVDLRDVVSDEELERARLFQIRRDTLRWGPDMLPPSKTIERQVAKENSYRDLDRWLEVPPGTFTAPYQKTPSPMPKNSGDD